ncbi:ead/Ea22-like family protein, partial [Enterobacter hormaechei]
MSNINKQALREMAERAASDSWGYDRDEFNDAITPSTVLALLDELEAKDSTIATQQQEIRTLLNALGQS